MSILNLSEAVIVTMTAGRRFQSGYIGKKSQAVNIEIQELTGIEKDLVNTSFKTKEH
ncbi:unnamed protein product [Ixodes persulcatus]